jgi:hypothetical protein
MASWNFNIAPAKITSYLNESLENMMPPGQWNRSTRKIHHFSEFGWEAFYNQRRTGSRIRHWPFNAKWRTNPQTMVVSAE